jgi:hypothetical protein
MSQTLAIGNYLELVPRSGSDYRFQNFHIGKIGVYRGNSDYSFLPFGFSGITVNRQGDNVDAELVFPNNAISRPWATQAIQERWEARIRTVRVDPDNINEAELLFPYVGLVSSGGWDDTALTLRLNTVLDAVGTEVPHRALTENLVGPLPVTSNVRL